MIVNGWRMNPQRPSIVEKPATIFKAAVLKARTVFQLNMEHSPDASMLTNHSSNFQPSTTRFGES